HRKVLIRDTLESRVHDLFSEDRVRLSQRIEFFFGYLPDNSYRETGTRERLAPYVIRADTQLSAHRAHFVLEQLAQLLYYLVEIYNAGQTADVVMALYRRSVARAALYHVGVNGTLYEIVHLANLLSLALENAYEFFA